MDLNSLKRKVAELLVVRASGHLTDSQRKYPSWELSNSRLKDLLEKGVGGVIFLGGSFTELQKKCEMACHWAGKPLLLCADVEEGLGQRFDGGTHLAPPMAIAQLYQKDNDKALKFAENYGKCIGFQARRSGLNWVLAPVCDVNNNPANPVINMRAWGEDPFTVQALTSSFQKGIASQGVLSCAKHFPGHGDSSIDSHLELATLDFDINRLKECELIPFKGVIKSGVDAIMSAHLIISQLDSDQPATFSYKILTNLLREELDFQGIIVTDALIMRSISNHFDPRNSALKAFLAGADIIMMPENAEQAIDSIANAFYAGEIPIDRLEESLLRRRHALNKYQKYMGRFQKKEFSCLDFELEKKEHISLSIELAESSLEIRHTERIQSVDNGINFIRIDEAFPSFDLSNRSPSISLPNEFGYKTVISNDLGISPWKNDSLEPFALDRIGQGPILLQLFFRGKPFQGTLHNKEPWILVVQQLQKYNRLAGLVVYGSKYLWNDLRDVIQPEIPSAYSPGQIDQCQFFALSKLFGSTISSEFLEHQSFEFSD